MKEDATVTSIGVESSRNNQLQDLRAGLAKLETLENQLRDAPWNNDASPRAIADFQTSILERYKRSKSIYIQRRVEQLVAQHIPTFDPNTNTFKHPDPPEDGHCNGNENENVDQNGTNEKLNARRDQALSKLDLTVKSINSKLQHMRDSYQAVCSRRKELAQMVEDLEGGDGGNDENSDNNDNQSVMMDTSFESLVGKEETITNVTASGSSASFSDEDIASEQQRLEELQKKKRRLQERLDLLRKEKLERENSVSVGQTELEELKKEEAELLKSGKDMSYFHKKIEELKEMKEFYDNVRSILEELGGVKIVRVHEDKDSQHLQLTLLMYEEYEIRVELEVFRQSSLKLVDAKWISKPIVRAVSSSSNADVFYMTMNPLDDLVQIAKTSMGPPHDVRFVIREVCARIRIMQNHVDDLALLRERHGVLTKVDTNDRIICSFNDGIVIVLRLYDHWVRMEQVVGVNGWDQTLTDKIRDAIPTKDETLKPTDVVSMILLEIEKLKEAGKVHPSTPELPNRQTTANKRNDDDDNVEMKDAPIANT